MLALQALNMFAHFLVAVVSPGEEIYINEHRALCYVSSTNLIYAFETAELQRRTTTQANKERRIHG